MLTTPPKTLILEDESYLFLQGDDADAMYLVKTGELGIFISDYMIEKMVNRIGPGELIGEMSLFDGLSRSASAKALKRTEVIVLPYENLRAELSTMPEWVQISIRTIVHKIRQANNMVLNVDKKKEPNG
jgi:CRP/FNR family cyclic AMP-dependent transcriptional regulator